LLLALLLDVLFGEPPERFHPVVWMGRALAWLEVHAPRTRTTLAAPERVDDVATTPARLGYGAIGALGSAAAWACAAALLERLAPWWPVQALLLKPTFAGRALLDAAAGVELSLRASHLAEARRGLNALVSRPTAELSPSLVAAAAIESLAENLVDSWVAPLLAYTCFGLAGAYAYRAANTADAMWGYRTPGYEHLGKVAARLDDLLTFVPARLGALLLAMAGPRPLASLTVWRRDARRTTSPNAGQPMAAIAGQLNVRLEKPGQYVLNAAAPEPSVPELAAARALVARAMLLAALLALTAAAAVAARQPWAHQPPPPPRG
jgi:adenosylcobinamide-phosphate synthase